MSSKGLTVDGDAVMSPEELAQLRFTHQTDQAAYFLKVEKCFGTSPLDIRSKFADSSPHTLVSSSSCSSNRNSPDETGPAFHDESQGKLVIANSQYSSDSPASSHRSEDDQSGEPQHGFDPIRVTRRKQNKPVRYDTDLDLSTQAVSSPTNSSFPEVTVKNEHEKRSTDSSPVDEGEAAPGDHVSTSISSPGLEGPHERRGSIGGRVFPTGPTGVQIFNTDAYCYLCNREFCNKYFLKTHKANKHGVYDPNVPAVSPGDRHAEDEGLLSPTPAPQQHEDLCQEAPFNLSFPSINPFLLEQNHQNTGSSRDGKSDSSAHSNPASRAESDTIQALLRQRLAQMYAQNMALHQLQLYHQNPTAQAAFFPGMLNFPAGGMNLVNFLAAPQHMLPWPQEPHLMGTLHGSPPPAFHQQPACQSSASSDRKSFTEEDNTCDVCQKKLSSVNFLKIHRRKKHGIDDLERGPLRGQQETSTRTVKNEPIEELQVKKETSPNMSVSVSPLPETCSRPAEISPFTRDSSGLGTPPVPTKTKRRSKKKNFFLEKHQAQEQQTQLEQRSRTRDDSRERPSSTTTGQTAYSHHPPPPLIRQLMAMPGAPPVQFSNLQRLLQDSMRDGRGSGRETYRCSECMMDFASHYFLEAHFRKTHHTPHSSLATTPHYDPTSEVLDLSTPKSRSRRTGENQAPTALIQSQACRTPSPRKRPHITLPPEGRVKAEDAGEEGVVPAGAGGGGHDLECYCTKCSREYCSKYFLKTHLMKEHQMTMEQYHEEVRQVYPLVWQQYTAPPGAMDSASSAQVSSTSRRNWCRYCKKDFCNKYFFKTHMQKMHNETVSSVASHRNSKKRSKGVPCEICNKVLCSKYFLRIHKRNTHGIHEDSSLEPNAGPSPSFVPSMSTLAFPEASFQRASMPHDEEEDELVLMETDPVLSDEEEGDRENGRTGSSETPFMTASSPSSPRTPSFPDGEEPDHDRRSCSRDTPDYGSEPDDEDGRFFDGDLGRKDVEMPLNFRSS